MGTTYLQLCQKFRKQVGISGTGPAAVTGQSGMNEKITIWVADADEWIQRKWSDWKFLLEPQEIITATAGTRTFTLSTLGITDLAKWKRTSFVRSPGTANYQKLSWDMTFEEYLESEYYLGVEETGDIDRVVVRSSDNALIFIPTPTANTTVWGAYYKTPTRMSADTSETPIPERFREAILYRAKMFYAEHLEDITLYQSAEKDFKDILVQLEADQLEGSRGMTRSADFENLSVVVE